MRDVEASIPAQLEQIYQAVRPPNDDELLRIVDGVIDTARTLMIEDPRGWTSLAAMVGYQIGRANHYHKLSHRQYDLLVSLCMLELKKVSEANP